MKRVDGRSIRVSLTLSTGASVMTSSPFVQDKESQYRAINMDGEGRNPARKLSRCVDLPQ